MAEVKAGLKTKSWFEVRDKDGNLKQKGEIIHKEEVGVFTAPASVASEDTLAFTLQIKGENHSKKEVKK